MVNIFHDLGGLAVNVATTKVMVVKTFLPVRCLTRITRTTQYYDIENVCSLHTTQRLEVRAIVFDVCLVEILLYGTDVWGVGNLCYQAHGIK